MTRAPVIGITTYDRNEQPVVSPLYESHFTLPALYVDAVRRAGGIPMLVPPGATNPAEVLATVDAIILIGGTDIAPSLYGGTATYPKVLLSSPARDRDEALLLRAAIAAGDIPILCICRGMQLLNVAYGGTLHAHLPDVVSPDIHRGPDGLWTVQDVAVTEGSALARVMGTTAVATYSGHHQGVATVGDGLEVSAIAADGIVEGLEIAGHPFCLGVQWHPEVSAASDPTQQALFDGLVTAAKAQ